MVRALGRTKERNSSNNNDNTNGAGERQEDPGGEGRGIWHCINRLLENPLLVPMIFLVGSGLYYGHTVGSNIDLRSYYDTKNNIIASNPKPPPEEDVLFAPTTFAKNSNHNNHTLRKDQTQNSHLLLNKETPSIQSTHQAAAAASNIEATPQQRHHIKQRRQREETEKPMNIVLFYADDWTMKVMGKLNPQVQTPNIDRMADNGVLFSNNCVTTSMCWISRASMMTGVYAAVHGESEPSRNQMFTSNPWNETVFPLLKKAGYYTGLVGKWHAPQPEEYMPMTFDYTNFYFGAHWEERDGKQRHVTDLNREDSMYFLKRRPKKKLFALKVSFFATHAVDGEYPSYQPMKHSKENLYTDPTPLEKPKTATDKHWTELPYFFREGNEGRNRWHKRWEPDYYQDNIRDLYRLATEVDEVVGDIIQELKKQGVYDNTLLIFTTDNGNMHGEHGLAEKWFPFEESIRVPLVIQDPRMPAEVKGTVNKDWTLNIDLAPTMLGAAQIEPSSFMQGRDIADLYLGGKNGNGEEWRQDFFYEYNRGHPITAEGHNGMFWIDASFALITHEWKYVYWPEHKYEQLYHRSLDPYEEWDMLHHPNVTQIQTTDEIYQQMKTRYAFLKNWSQSGKHV